MGSADRGLISGKLWLPISTDYTKQWIWIDREGRLWIPRTKYGPGRLLSAPRRYWQMIQYCDLKLNASYTRQYSPSSKTTQTMKQLSFKQHAISLLIHLLFKRRNYSNVLSKISFMTPVTAKTTAKKWVKFWKLWYVKALVDASYAIIALHTAIFPMWAPRSAHIMTEHLGYSQLCQKCKLGK